jgi:hypothetical protein
VACGRGEPTAEDCAIRCWSDALVKLGAHREANGQWRANCPVPDCGAERSLEYDAPGKHVRWRSFCGRHDREAVRPHLAGLIGPCMPRNRPAPAIGAELIALALADLPPQSLRLALMEMAGMPTGEALAKLGVGPTHKRRVIEPLRRLGRLPVLVSFRRSARLPISVSLRTPVNLRITGFGKSGQVNRGMSFLSAAATVIPAVRGV